ncbi:MAG: histidine kinase [Chitinophagaceae bacterium]|nr:MAG: histidine kinase [Chitinophagaceae bacterium]
MTFSAVILSQQPASHRVRHLLFWSVFLLYFYFQSIHPQAFTDLSKPYLYRNALINVFGFAPVCVVVVYCFRAYMLPLVKTKNYTRAVLLFFGMYLGATALNCIAAQIVFRNVTQHTPVDTSFLRTVDAASWNARWAVIVGFITMGISLARDWYLQTRANVAMLELNAKAEMRIEKSRIHPEWLFRALDKINTAVRTHTPSSTAMILNLSDLLSYSLYESDDDLVPLEKELLGLHHLVSLEQCDKNDSFYVIVNIEGDTDNKHIEPMSVINRVVQHITDVVRADNLPCNMQLHFTVIDSHLVLHSKLLCENNRNESILEWKLSDLPERTAGHKTYQHAV